ncbi:carbohydrate ABC transporter permease [Paenibacillus ferrarius]|uniref:carbohydrate ABC transporter permease n=1 Tax=Paenibacillus ferrarius TaxID=1469647 RepID=UPI003D28F4A0
MNKSIYPFYFSIGALVLYLIFFIIPGFAGIYYSFTDWNGYSDEIVFVGLDNFRTIFSGNEKYLSYLNNTVTFTITTTILKTAIGLFLALILNQGVRGKNFHRVVVFMPVIVPTLIVGLIFKSVLHPEVGLVNETLRSIGLGALAKNWLTDIHFAFKSIIAVDTWKGIGYIMVILLAGLQAIPDMYYEAAEMDGANFWNKFRHIMLPLLMPALTVTTVLNFIYGFKVFDIVYALTNGGPGYVTEVLYTGVFKEFSQGRYGIGTALSTVMFLVMIVIGFWAVKFMSKEDGVYK